MSALPEQYQKYAATHGQHIPHPRMVELHDEADPIVHVPDPDNPQGFVRVRRSALHPAAPTPPRDLAPQPLLDPTAQRYVGAGIGGGVLLWGGGQFLIGAGHLISSLSGVGALLFFLALAGARTMLGGRRAGTHVEVHQHARGFGRNNVTM